MANGAPDLDDGYLYLPSDIFPDEDDVAGHHDSRNVNLADVTRSSMLSSFSSSSSSSSTDGRKNLSSSLPPPLPSIANKNKGWMLHHGFPGMERSRDVQIPIPSRYPFVAPRIGATQLLASGFTGKRGSSGGTGVFLPRVARGDAGEPNMDFGFAEQKNRGEQEQQQYNGPVNGRGVGESWRRKQSLAHQPSPPYWTW